MVLSSRPLLAALAGLVAACSSPPSGTVDGISYATSLEGSYTLIVRGEGREHVWVSSDREDPMLSLRVSGVPTPVGQDPQCAADDSFGWGSGFIVDPDGELAQGDSVMVGLCSTARPDVGLMCSVYRANGHLAEGDREGFAAVCHAIRVQ